MCIESEILLPIEKFDSYYISNYGNVYSTKKGTLIKLKPFLDSKKRYFMVTLSNNGKKKKVLVHRLVGNAFAPNPHNFPEINHLDTNGLNNYYQNLEWCDHKYNIYYSYQTMSQTRNYFKCKIIKNDKLIKEFNTTKDAIEYAVKTFGASRTSLIKYLRYGDIYLLNENSNRKYIADKKIHKTQIRTELDLYYKNNYLGRFKSFCSIKRFLHDEFEINVSDTYLRKCLKYKEFSIKRVV